MTTGDELPKRRIIKILQTEEVAQPTTSVTQLLLCLLTAPFSY